MCAVLHRAKLIKKPCVLAGSSCSEMLGTRGLTPYQPTWSKIQASLLSLNAFWTQFIQKCVRMILGGAGPC